MASVNREITVLKRMFNLSIREELTDKNPCWKIKMLAKNNARNRILSPEELERLISNLPNHAARIIHFAYLTGIRAGEIFNLTWDKVNLKQRASRLEAADTNTSEPRVIYLNDEVLGILHEAGRVRRLGHNRVFTYQGRPIMSIPTAFLKACSRGGIENLRLHDLRHTSNPDNSPDNKELGGTGFPACAKNTLLFRVI